MIPQVLRCRVCSGVVTTTATGLQCGCNASRFEPDGDGILVNCRLPVAGGNEMRVRDEEAHGYLRHRKFPTQIASFDDWLAKVPAGGGIALDLGCGPGPYTRRLLQAGYRVLAVDFSRESLRLNASDCREAGSGAAVFLQADLNELGLQPQSVDLLLMADFLQHLGGRSCRRRLLQEAVLALRPGGCFYLSFFNLNIKHYLKGDVHGDFAGGKIGYERLTLANVLADLPTAAVVDTTRPMNVFHRAGPDRLMSALPFARYLARMMVITGSRQAAGRSGGL